MKMVIGMINKKKKNVIVPVFRIALVQVEK